MRVSMCACIDLCMCECVWWLFSITELPSALSIEFNYIHSHIVWLNKCVSVFNKISWMLSFSYVRMHVSTSIHHSMLFFFCALCIVCIVRFVAVLSHFFFTDFYVGSVDVQMRIKFFFLFIYYICIHIYAINKIEPFCIWFHRTVIRSLRLAWLDFVGIFSSSAIWFQTLSRWHHINM